MSDLTSGKYPDTYEEWMLDGQPSQPYRTTIKRSDIISTGVLLTQANLFVYPVVVQQGDVIGAISIGVKTATATPTHGWAALYSGVGTSAVLLSSGQSTDDTSGFHGSNAAQKFTLASPYTVGPNPGSTGSNGPLVLGVALYNSGATGGTLDGMTGSNVTGAQILTSQIPMVNSVALAATATAPANLAGIAAATGGVPYIVLSRS